MLHDPALEAGLVSAAMLWPETIAVMATAFDPEDVHDERHRAVLEALFDLDAGGHPVDVVTLSERLRASGKEKLVGGLDGLGRMSDAVHFSQASVPRHAAQLRRWADARRIGTVAAEIAESARGSVDDPGRFTDWASSSLSKSVRTQRKLARHVRDIAEEVVNQAINDEKVPAIYTRFADLNRVLDTGFEAGTLTIICARPGVGKSVFAMDLADEAAKRTDVLVFSLEMPESEIIRRRLAARTRIPFNKIAGRAREPLTDQERTALRREAHNFRSTRMQIDDTGGIPISEMRARARVWRRAGDESEIPPMLVVDYLQLAKGEGRSREEEVSSISRGCKEMAKELECAVVALCQINRESEKRSDNKPKLHDLRESGALEQDADKVIGLWRKSTNAENADHRIGEAIVLKNRQGRQGTAHLAYFGDFYTFESAASPPDNRREQPTGGPPNTRWFPDRSKY